MKDAAASTSNNKPAFEIGFPGPSAASDSALINHLTSLINDVYQVAEAGMFSTSAHRTNVDQVTTLLTNNELALAYPAPSASSSHGLPLQQSLPIGCVRVTKLNAATANIGMLVASPTSRGTGLGTHLMDFAELMARQWGCSTMQLELLVPSTWKHEVKEFLQKWYLRRSYQVVRVEDFAASYPEIAKELVTEVEYRIMQKNFAEQ